MAADTGKGTSLAHNRWKRFKKNRRGYYSLLLFLTFLGLSLFAEVLSNDKPLYIHYQGTSYFPLLKMYPETTFGGIFETETDYRDPFILDQLHLEGNFVLFPPNPHSFNSINLNIDRPVPAPPSKENFLGTDDRGRDVLARLIYGFRLSVLFGTALTAIGTLLGIVAGSVQGFLVERRTSFFNDL